LDTLSSTGHQPNLKSILYTGQYEGKNCYLAVFYRERDNVVNKIKLIFPKIPGRVTAKKLYYEFRQNIKDNYFVLNEIGKDTESNNNYRMPSWTLTLSAGEIHAYISNYDYYEYYDFNLVIDYKNK